MIGLRSDQRGAMSANLSLLGYGEAMNTTATTVRKGITVTLTWTDTPHGRSLTSVSFEGQPDNPVMSADLRVPLSQLTQQATPATAHEDVASLREEWPNGDLHRLYRELTDIYNGAMSIRTPARNAVANAFGVSRATAGRMIAAAREAGYPLAPYSPFPGKSGPPQS